MVTAKCLHCGSEYHPYPSHLRTGRTHFCSRACSDARRYGLPEERFWLRVQKTSRCWTYQGGARGLGYRGLQVEGRHIPAHRFSWELHFGPIPDGMLVCHKCDNPPCVRPSHLFLGTHADNATDKTRKGRAARCGPTNPKRGTMTYNAKLTETDIKNIRERHANGEASQRALSREYGVCKSTIMRIVRRVKWAHVP